MPLKTIPPVEIKYTAQSQSLFAFTQDMAEGTGEIPSKGFEA